MKRASPDPTWGTYQESFRQDAHQLLAWGYEDARSKLRPDSEETEVTGFIAEAIEDRLNSFDLPEKFEHYYLREDNPIRGEGRTGKRRRRMDIVVQSIRYKPRPRYILEAKRLAMPNNPIGDYVGEEGLMRFVRSTYGGECPEAAMLGYIQSDDAERWRKLLQKRFNVDHNNEFRFNQNGKELRPESVNSSLKHEWFTHHERGHAPIKIYHIFLDCCGEGSV